MIPPSPPPLLTASDCSKMDAVVLAHLAALQLGQQAHPNQPSAADGLAVAFRCPPGCMAAAAATGAGAVLKLALERGSPQVRVPAAVHSGATRPVHTFGPISMPPPAFQWQVATPGGAREGALLQLQDVLAEERVLEGQGPDGRTAAALRMERAKAMRPCASLACRHLAADPELRGKRCSGCQAVRYCCAEDQAHDWRAGGHRQACRLLRGGAAAGGGM